MKIYSDSMNLEAAKKFVIASPLLVNAAEVMDDYTVLQGKSAVEVYLKGDLEKDPFEKLVLKDMDGYFTHELVGFPVYISRGILTVTPEWVCAQELQGMTQGIEFWTHGTVSNIRDFTNKNEPLIPDFQLIATRFDFSKFLTFAQAPMTPQEVKKIAYSFDDFHGMAAIDAKVRPESWNLSVVPANVSAVYQPYDTFILFNSGSVDISDDGVNLNSLKGVLSESTFKLDGFLTEKKFDLTANMNINSTDIGKVRFYSDVPLVANGVIPLSLSLKGEPDDWDLLGRMVLEKGAYLSYLTDIGLPRDQLRLINIEAEGSREKLQINRLGLDMGDKNLVTVYGIIDDINSKKPKFKDFVIKTNTENPISTNYFNPSIGCVLNNGCQNFFSNGDLKANLKLNGYISQPNILGALVFQNIAIPDYQTHAALITVDFKNNNTTLDIKDLNIGESRMNINALMDSKMDTPMLVKNLKINSSLLNLDELTKILSKGTGGQAPQGLPPLVVTNGTLNSGEMILRDLITSNVQAKFNFTPDWLLSIPKLSLTATNGAGNGNVFYNFRTSELSSNFKFNGMQANALATTLLSLPNEVYGTVNGSVQFSTRGKSQQELIANSNGYAEFRISDGRLVRLGSLEHLLRAANVIQSGVGGFNINNIIDLIAPQKTGHFETLQGNVYAKNGVLYTDDITSKGKNLSLFISGKLDMLTNEADVQVLGRLSKKVAGKLGPVGSLSINQFIDYIPGIGFLPATPERKGVIDLIPGLSKIPGLALADDGRYRRFIVIINGDLYEQSSVKSFRWVE